MKKLLLFCLLAGILFSYSCIKPSKEDDSTLNGSTDIPVSKSGNTFSTYISANGQSSGASGSASVTKNDAGVATVHVTANIKNAPGLTFIKNLIPTKYMDAQGNVILDGKVKATDEGLLDYTNADGKPFVMVRYDCSVGDTYKLTKADGKIITRTVTQKSTTDDFSYGLMYIKTITVEQDSRIPGIKKIIYKFNHKFGIVYVEAVASDGTKAGMLVYPQNY
jgi:formylmethanofuran dehydrogenase subunit D